MYIYMCVCVCVCTNTHARSHRHTRIYIYIYIYILFCGDKDFHVIMNKSVCVLMAKDRIIEMCFKQTLGKKLITNIHFPVLI